MYQNKTQEKVRERAVHRGTRHEAPALATQSPAETDEWLKNLLIDERLSQCPMIRYQRQRKSWRSWKY